MAGERGMRRLVRALLVSSSPLIAAMGLAQQAAAGSDHPAFASSDRCIACHGDAVDADGHDVSIGRAWRATMMAQSARDPYWQAGVRRELTDRPHLQAEIEDTCSVCHMPMARTMARADGRTGELFAHLNRTAANPVETRNAWDGVSCTVCHQIGPDDLGEASSFNGGYRISPSGAGAKLYGPFEIDAGRQRIMLSASGYAPAQSAHIQESELCATCHTLFTPAVDGAGDEIGEFPEQVPYLEWLHSSYPGDQSCQDCHMPAMTAPISSVLGEPREGFSSHAFRGGNVFMLKLLDRYRDELSVTTPSAELQRSAATTLEHLQTRSARVDLVSAERVGSALIVDVEVRNLAGHKLPTAYPSRRAWIHLEVRDQRAMTVFESGMPNADGSILGNDNDEDASRYEPHYQEIVDADQVQIYEPIIFDYADEVTTSLLSGVRYAKDNRLLPEGFDKSTAGDAVDVHGRAAGDADFRAGGDTIRYRVELPEGTSAATVRVRLMFQTIGARWARNLEAYDTPETNRFVGYYAANASESAVELAAAERQIR